MVVVVLDYGILIIQYDPPWSTGTVVLSHIIHIIEGEKNPHKNIVAQNPWGLTVYDNDGTPTATHRISSQDVTDIHKRRGQRLTTQHDAFLLDLHVMILFHVVRMIASSQVKDVMFLSYQASNDFIL